MPPKAKGKGKGKGKGGAGNIIDGVDTTVMTREQLEIFVHRIKEENEREREERNFFQLERDKLRTFWEITRSELEESRAKLRNKDRQIEEAAEKNDEELKFYKQKVKHLEYEHQRELTECKAAAMVSLKMAQDDHTEQERELLRDKRDLKSKGREQEIANQEQIKSLKLEFSEEINNSRQEFETSAKELEMKYEKKFNNLKQELRIKHKMELSEIEERKNTQITELTKYHEKSFNEIKNYYNDITLNNLALISSLKDQMEVLRKQNERMTKQVSDLTSDNKKMSEPLKQALSDVTEYQRQLQNYEKDKLSLANTKSKLAATQKQLDDLNWSNSAMELRFEKLQAEMRELQNRFVRAVLELQQKTGLKNALLQKRVNAMDEQAQISDAVIGQLRAKSEYPVDNKKLEVIMQKKDQRVKELMYELARVSKAHDDLLNTYEQKLTQYGIPKMELGYEPMRFLPEGQGGLAKGPAGLIAKTPADM